MQLSLHSEREVVQHTKKETGEYITFTATLYTFVGVQERPGGSRPFL